MPTGTVINFNNNVGSGAKLGPADHWDGYVEPLGRNILGGIYQGTNLNWGGFDSQATNNPFFNQPYSGYNTNWGSININGVIGGFTNDKYTGYTTNWGSYEESANKSLIDTDLNSIVDYPKDQITYYKLKGYNPLTSAYESWVVSQNITGRPGLDGGLFDPNPGRQPPNVERDVFKTPPSGNSLVNIIIVARWIE